MYFSGQILTRHILAMAMTELAYFEHFKLMTFLRLLSGVMNFNILYKTLTL